MLSTTGSRFTGTPSDIVTRVPVAGVGQRLSDKRHQECTQWYLQTRQPLYL